MKALSIIVAIETRPMIKVCGNMRISIFNARNPMLYNIRMNKDINDIAIIAVSPTVLDEPRLFITTGNAASHESEILPVKEGIKSIQKTWKVISSEWWKREDGSLRKMMAECLVPSSISPSFIHTVYVASQKSIEKIRPLLSGTRIALVPQPDMFFLPLQRYKISPNITLIDGDMFFSSMQTLTISVNVVGVMGKGLASRAKYQFPDVYVVYQDACRQRKLQMGKPFLYKRESLMDEELAAPGLMTNPNSNKWFLLFATKNDWRNDSDIEGIERGLAWLVKNYKSSGIKSLAMPALGCGLGNLEWKDVGPLMCKYLSQMDIPTAVYLPREHPIAPEFLQSSFLLSQVDGSSTLF
jgi:hypothetical protein